MTRLQLISPVDGSSYAERPAAGPAELDQALSEAEAAQRDWAATPIAARTQIVRAAYEQLGSRAQALATELAWQMGRPVAYGPSELARARERAEYLCDVAEDALAEAKMGPAARIRREPMGVVLVISPWNYPYLTVTNALAPALAAGNAVVLKPSFQAALCAEAIAAAFREAGLPQGVLQVLHADDPTTLAAVRDPRVAHVVFTGSVAVGGIVAAAAAERLVPVTLELGGKDPAYVRADADVAHAAVQIADGAFFNSGQSCCGVERVYVHRSVFRDVVDALVAEAERLRLGDPLAASTTLGPMARVAGAELARRHVRDARAKGARALLDEPSALPGPAYVPPQVLVDVDHGMSVMREETFGPVVGVMPVAEDREAVRLMNDSAFGLTASVWTRDPAAAEALAPALECGTVYLNRCDYLDPALPWSGRKASGLGLSLSHLAYQAMTRPKSLVF